VGSIANHKETSKQAACGGGDTRNNCFKVDSFHQTVNKSFIINTNIVRKGTRTVTAYTEEFYRLASRCDLVMTEEQQVTKYISGLKYPIQECVILHDVFSVDEAHIKALKVESLQSKAPPFRRSTPFEKCTSGAGVQPSSITVSRSPARQSTNTPTSALATITTANVKSKENLFAKSGVGKFYTCGRPGHKSNEYPKRNQVNLVDYEDDWEEEIEIESLDETNFAEEQEDSVTCVIQS